MITLLLGKGKELVSMSNNADIPFENLLQDFSKSLNKLVPDMEQKKENYPSWG